MTFNQLKHCYASNRADKNVIYNMGVEVVVVTPYRGSEGVMHITGCVVRRVKFNQQ